MLNKKDLYSMSKDEISSIIMEGRKILDDKTKISYPTDLLPLITFRKSEQEHFAVGILNGAHQVIEVQTVSIGILNRTLVHPREVFKRAIELSAASIILIHNHPSGNLEPSTEDIEVTKRIVSAGEIIGIKVLDHMIVGKYDYKSFAETDNTKLDNKERESFIYTSKRTRAKGQLFPYNYKVDVYHIINNLPQYKFTFHYYGPLSLDIDFKVRDSLKNGESNGYYGYREVYLTEIKNTWSSNGKS